MNVNIPMAVGVEPKALIITQCFKSIWTRVLLTSLLAAFLAVSGVSRALAEDVSVWIYHDFPPYIVDEDQEIGISYDLARLMTEMSDGQYQFNIEVVPRQRLNQRLSMGEPGIVMWANHAWFGDKDRTKFLWTTPVLDDKNDIISPKSVSLQYDGPMSLQGMTLVGVRGHKYPGVDDLIADGVVERIDMKAEGEVIQFIATGRGNVAIVAHSAARYFVQKLGLSDRIHFSDTPHSTYKRYVLVQPQLVGVHDFLNSAVLRLERSRAWIEILEKYNLTVALL